MRINLKSLEDRIFCPKRKSEQIPHKMKTDAWFEFKNDAGSKAFFYDTDEGLYYMPGNQVPCCYRYPAIRRTVFSPMFKIPGMYRILVIPTGV